jgi:hypothetical protein
VTPRTLLVAAALTALAAPARAGDAPEETPYYPLKVGTTWTYRDADAPGAAKIVVKVARQEKVGDVLCARVETHKDGKAAGYEHVAVAKDGVYRHSINGLRPDRPLLLLKLPPRGGDEWPVAGKLGGETFAGTMTAAEEDVAVPAGKYRALVVSGEVKVGDAALASAHAFAKDVGPVRVRTEAQGQVVRLELEKFEPGK